MRVKRLGSSNVLLLATAPSGVHPPGAAWQVRTASWGMAALPQSAPRWWVRSVKEECLSRLLLFGEASLRHALTQYVEHFHHERNHQGKGTVLLFPVVS